VEAVPDNHFTGGLGGEVGDECHDGFLSEWQEETEACGVEDVGGEVTPKRPPHRAIGNTVYAMAFAEILGIVRRGAVGGRIGMVI